MSRVVVDLSVLEALEAANACKSVSNSGDHPDAVLEKVSETLMETLKMQVPIDELDAAAKLAGWEGGFERG